MKQSLESVIQGKSTLLQKIGLSRLLPGHPHLRDITHWKKEGLNCYNFFTRGKSDAPVRRMSLRHLQNPAERPSRAIPWEQISISVTVIVHGFIKQIVIKIFNCDQGMDTDYAGQ